MTTNAGILGVSGYTGQELVRYLNQHPHINITALFSTSLSGKLSRIVPKFSHLDLPDVQEYDVELCHDLDILFLAVPHTKAMPLVVELTATCPSLKIVDLSADFRLNDVATFESYYQVQHTATAVLPTFVYGLPEKYRDAICSAQLVANPGCYATAMILGTMPLADRLDSTVPMVIDAKSGTSGAGKSLKQSSLFCEVNENLSAYATGTHRHMAELVQETGLSRVMFSPHLLPIDRGIEAAIYFPADGMTQDALLSLYESAYDGHPFTTVMGPDTVPSLSLVQQSNRCVIIPKVVDDWVIVFSLIDNLGKGASGQAVQNANLMLGYDETAGIN